MNDPHDLGLDDLGQRVQALADTANEQRRYYRGAPLPVGPSSAGHVIPSFDAARPFDPAPTTATPVATPRLAPPQPQDGFSPAPFSPAPSSSVPFNSAQFNTPQSNPPQPGQAPMEQRFSDSSFPPLAPAQAAGPATLHISEVHVTAAAPPAPPVAPPAAAPAGTQSQPLLASGTGEDPNAPRSGLQRAVALFRTAMPLVQKLLPLLDGNFATAIGSMLTTTHPPQHHAPAPPQQVKVDLEPVERSLAELRTGQRDLRGQVQEQVTALKRVEDQLERVREATDRNTLEQQEMVEDLRAVGNRVSNLAIAGVIILALSLGLNIYFLIQLMHILR